MHRNQCSYDFAIIFSPHTVALKPFTFVRVSTGISKASQNFTNSAAFLAPLALRVPSDFSYLFAFYIIALASVCNSTNGSAVQSDKSNSNTLAVVSFYLEECPLSAILESAMAVSPVQFSISSHTRFRSSVHSM